MDAGVPIKAAVAGIAMGLITGQDDKYAILSDIQGIEDFLGDMDFKVAGTAEGINALQMDVKIKGLTADILRQALEQARVGRLHILDKMNETLSEARTQMSRVPQRPPELRRGNLLQKAIPTLELAQPARRVQFRVYPESRPFGLLR